MKITKLAEHYSRSIGYANAAESEVLSFELRSDGKYRETSGVMEGGMHITRVTVNMGGTIHIIDADGVKTIEGKPTGRGVSVFTQYADEYESKTVYERHEQFHKGQINREITRVEGPELTEDRQDIWRD